MKLTLVRDKYTADSTFGTLAINGVFECHTLEDLDRKMEAGGVKVYGKTAIPRGTYKVIIDFSPHFGRDLPHVLDVPDFIGVRIHPGNTSGDTDGCVLVGKTRLDDAIGQSRIAFDSFFTKLDAAFEIGEEITLEVS